MDKQEKKFGFAKRTWEELKALVASPQRFYVKTGTGAHPGAKHGDKITNRPAAFKTIKRPHLYASTKSKFPTNHVRVQMGRAAKMRVSLAEYRRRFCQ